MKDIKLRKQIVDCLKYIKREVGYYPPREQDEIYVGTYMDGYRLIDIWNEYGNDETVFIYAESVESYDGFADNELTIKRHQIQDDIAYFDYLCTWIQPSEYQLQEYQTYLRLKHKFGE